MMKNTYQLVTVLDFAVVLFICNQQNIIVITTVLGLINRNCITKYVLIIQNQELLYYTFQLIPISRALNVINELRFSELVLTIGLSSGFLQGQIFSKAMSTAMVDETSITDKLFKQRYQSALTFWVKAKIRITF